MSTLDAGDLEDLNWMTSEVVDELEWNIDSWIASNENLTIKDCIDHLKNDLFSKLEERFEERLEEGKSNE